MKITDVKAGVITLRLQAGRRVGQSGGAAACTGPDCLDAALSAQEAGLVPPILAEVLQGFREDADFERAQTLLVRLPVLEQDVRGHVGGGRGCSGGSGAKGSGFAGPWPWMASSPGRAWPPRPSC